MYRKHELFCSLPVNTNVFFVAWNNRLSNCFRPYYYDNTSSVTTENSAVSDLLPVVLTVSDSQGYKADTYCKWLIKAQHSNSKLMFDVVESNVYPVSAGCTQGGVVVYTGPDVHSPRLGTDSLLLCQFCILCQEYV